MRKLLSYLFLLTIIFVNAQNDNCSEAITLNVGTDFASGAITSTNVGATTDGPIPSCSPNVKENVWFKVIVPASGKIMIQTQRDLSSLYNDSLLSVYSGTCGSLTQIACDDDSGAMFFSFVSLSNQIPGNTLYISVWKKHTIDSNNGQFQISAFDPVPPTNDNCSGAVPLATGTDFYSGVVTSTNLGATTDYNTPSCGSTASDNVWFTTIVPPSGKLTIETRKDLNSLVNNTTLSVYSGNCDSLTEIACNINSGQNFFSKIVLTGQTPGTKLYISVWKYVPNANKGKFQISAYETPVLSTHEVADSNKEVTVSPNPFNDILTISDISDVTSATVTDISGRLVKTIEKPSSPLQLGDLKEGIYFITLKLKDGSLKTIKTIKK